MKKTEKAGRFADEKPSQALPFFKQISPILDRDITYHCPIIILIISSLVSFMPCLPRRPTFFKVSST